MVAEGKLSAEEAADLLDALEPAPRAELRPLPVAAPGAPARPGGRTLMIQVSEGGEMKVNIRIPLALARAAGRFIPQSAQRSLSKYDIDLDQLLENLGHAANDGALLQIQDNDERVMIAVE